MYRLKKYLAMCFVFLLLFMNGCSNSSSSKIKLFGFDINNDISYVQGTFVTIEAPYVYDVKGNVYDIDYEVYNSKNQKIELNNSGFFASDLNGYKVVYSAYTASGKQKAETNITITPKTTANFRINYKQISNKGELYKFEIPETVLDNNILSYSVTKLEDNSLVECNDDGSFTPDSVGMYEVKVIAQREFGNVTDSFRVYVRPELTVGEIETFDKDWAIIRKYSDEIDIRLNKWKIESTEENGVKNRFNEDDNFLTLTTNDDYSEFYFAPRESKNYYEDLVLQGYDYISVWIRIECNYKPLVQRRLGYESNQWQYFDFQKNKWFEIVFPLVKSNDYKTTFLDYYDDYKEQSLACLVFDNYNKKDEIKIYVDDVYALKSIDLT